MTRGMTELEAELYALTHRGNPGDVEFYARACAGAERVLELGTGYGRLLPALLGAAKHVVGLDREPALLRAARRNVRRANAAGRGTLKLVEGDLRDFELRGLFDRILLPYNALYCLLGRRDLASCLARVRAHLAPGGQFLFDVWSADRFLQRPRASGHRDDRGAIVSLSHRRQVWDVFERSRLSSARQRLDVVYTYVARPGATRLEIPIPQRYASARQIRELLGLAGLGIDARSGDFAGTPPGRSAPFLVVQASARPPRGRT
jgi:SAM-dependent methyltransferase